MIANKKTKPNSRSSSITKKPDDSNITKSKLKKKTIKSNVKSVAARSKSKEKIVAIKTKKKSDEKDKEKESVSEIKIMKNVDTISRLINNSNEILAQQNSLLEKCEDLTKKVTSSDFEIERLLNKNENDDFPIFLEKYGSKLNLILSKLKLHTEEVEETKYIREENKNLKYKLELMSIDKNDSGLHYESRYNSLRNFLTNEFNLFNEFLADLGYEYMYHKFTNNNLQEEGIAIFFNNIKKLIKSNKLNSSDKENNSSVINQDKLASQEEIRILRFKLEEMKNRKGSVSENYNKNMEEDLQYYKNLVRDYEKQLEELKRFQKEAKPIMSNQITNPLPSNPVNLSSRKEKEENNPSSKFDKKFEIFDKERDRELLRKYQSCDESQFNPISSIANQSLENFRRNKDLRLSGASNNLLSEENMRLENTYSEASFYNPDYNQYNYQGK